LSYFFTDGIVVINSVKLLFDHPQGTHDDRFWALALAVYAAEKEAPPPAKPKAFTA
jgi:hypothetical protein